MQTSFVMCQSHSLHPREFDLSLCKLITYMTGLAWGFCTVSFVVWIDRNSLTHTHAYLKLPKNNSLWKHVLLSLVHSEMPSFCLGGSLTDNNSFHPSGDWTFQSKLKGAFVCYPYCSLLGLALWWRIQVSGISQGLALAFWGCLLRWCWGFWPRGSGLMWSFMFNKHSR